MEGWFKIHRQIYDSWVFTDPLALKLWIWLLGKARIDDGFVYVPVGGGGTTITLKRGELLFGRFKAEETLCINGSKIYRTLQRMSDDGMITIDANSHYSIITICNYDTYQGDDDTERTADEQHVNNKRTTSEQHLNTIKKDKKEKKDKKDKETVVENSTAFKICTDIYFDVYENKTGLKPSFSGAEGRHLKELIVKIKNSIIQKDGLATDEKVQDAFKYILSHLPKFYQDKIDLKIINSKYDGIIAEIRTKSGGGLENKVQDIINRYNGG